MKFVAAVIVFFGAASEVQTQCSWVTLSTTMDFGTYDVFGGASNVTMATGSVRCTGNLDVTVSSATGGAGVYNPRTMSGTALYNVYVDAGRTLIWGNGTAGTIQYAFTNTGGPNTYSGFAYGQVPGA